MSAVLRGYFRGSLTFWDSALTCSGNCSTPGLVGLLWDFALWLQCLVVAGDPFGQSFVQICGLWRSTPFRVASRSASGLLVTFVAPGVVGGPRKSVSES